MDGTHLFTDIELTLRVHLDLSLGHELNELVKHHQCQLVPTQVNRTQVPALADAVE